MNATRVVDGTGTTWSSVLGALTAGHDLSREQAQWAMEEIFSDNATAAQILTGSSAYVKGAKVEGSMPNNGSADAELDGLTVTSAVIPAGYTSGGTVSLTGDIEEALAAI